MANGNMRWVHGQEKKAFMKELLIVIFIIYLAISKLSQALQSGSAVVCYFYSIKLPNLSTNKSLGHIFLVSLHAHYNQINMTKLEKDTSGY